MHIKYCMSIFKNIQGSSLARLFIPENSGTKTRGNNGPGTINFENLLTESLKQLYSRDVPLNKNSANTTITIANPTRAIDLDDKAKFSEGLKIVFKHEGTRLVTEDGGGSESSKYGVIESTARAYGYQGDMKAFSKADAEFIYKKIWDKSGAGSLPYPLSVIHFDTFVNSPVMAKKLLKQSNGNVETYLDLRLQRYNRMAKLKPERYAKYLNGWTNRIRSLKGVAHAYANAQKTTDTNRIYGKT